mgnify:CR=1 FL=1
MAKEMEEKKERLKMRIVRDLILIVALLVVVVIMRIIK